MSIDTQAKRMSAIATRRLPWFRRFHLPQADGTIEQADRRQLAFVYGGILIIPPVVDLPTHRIAHSSTGSNRIRQQVTEPYRAVHQESSRSRILR